MNILPKKRWHVRTKQNIERVRRDEAKAAEEEKERQRKIQLAEQEARTDFLRKRARQAKEPDNSTAVVAVNTENASSKHVNLFQELDDGKKSWGTNKEHEAEERAEKEKFEQNIGLLTYLGQGSAETQSEKPWYFKDPEKRRFTSDEKVEEANIKKKSFLDPLQEMKKYLGPEHFRKSDKKHKKLSEEKHHKKHKHKDKSKITTSGKTIDELRAERLQREREERLRTEKLLAKMRGDKTNDTTPQIDGQQGYNSQFNPHLARQSKRV